MKILIFFFFQAEDGIRDLYVTGVQTCALPILAALGPVWAEQTVSEGVLANAGPDRWEVLRRLTGDRLMRPGDTGDGKRSEERRVGKECRSRWSPDQRKKTDAKVEYW